MKHITTRIGVIGATLATTGVLAAGGIAAACPLSSNSQSTRDTATTSSWSGNQRGNSGWANTSYRMSYTWNKWNPTTYSSNNEGSFSDWWSGVMNQASSYSAGWSASSTNNNWMPRGSNWQQSWSNWNPMVWESNGSSYSNWHNQFMSYMNSQMGTFQSEFSNS